MKLLNLIINNFKGIKKFEFTPNGCNASIFGRNGAGKTTIDDAFSWLLFGKDSQNRGNFEIKCLDESGEPAHNLNHEVEAELLLEDGSTVILGKAYKETWTKKRGGKKAEHTGHTTDHFVDGVPVSQKEYKAKIDSLIDEDMFKLITSPTFFCENMHWKDRREIVLEVAGDITDDDVIASNKKLKKLPGILNGKTIEDYRKIIAAKRKKINDQLEHIPTRIDEVTRGLPNIAGFDIQLIQAEVQDLTGRYKAMEEEIQAMEAGDTAEAKQALRELTNELQDMIMQHKQKVNQELNKIAEVIRDKRKQLMDVEQVRDNLLDKRAAHLKKIQRLETEMEQLRNDWKEIYAQQFKHVDQCSCPTCGQDLPESEIEDAREKALESFNLKKSESLKSIQEEGKSKREEAKRLELEVVETDKRIEPLSLEISELKKLIEKQQGMEKQMEQKKESYVETAEYQKMVSQIEALKDQLETQKDALMDRAKDKKEMLMELKVAIDKENQKLNMINQYEAANTRISELEEEEKILASEYEKLEEEIFLTEEFIRTKVQALEDEINSKFEITKFKLFEQQVNGGITETCMATYNGVPYESNLNKGARMNVGLDIIKTLSEHYGIKAPIFIDNKESVTSLIEMPCQLISLVVSEKDQALRVEIEKPNKTKEAV